LSVHVVCNDAVYDLHTGRIEERQAGTEPS
jgi:hypothetical protein